MGGISAIMSYNKGVDHLENNDELAEIHEVNNHNHVTQLFKFPNSQLKEHAAEETIKFMQL
jgi:hypothetical protein